MEAEFTKLIQNGSLEEVKEGLANGSLKQFLHRSICEGDFPLHVAAKARNPSMVRALLEAGANPNQGSEVKGSHKGYTAMHEAAGNGDIDILNALKDHKADCNRSSDDGWYPLHCAVYRGKQNAIVFLLDLGADVNCETEHHQTPLLFAVSHGRPRDVRLLLKHNASTNLLDSNGDTLMHHALHFRMSELFEGEYDLPESQLDVVVVLALNGVSPSTKNNQQNEATQYVEEDMPSLKQFLTVLYNNRSFLASVPLEWNYMSFLSAKAEMLASCGVPLNESEELCASIKATDEEKEQSKVRKLAERPQGGCPVMRGKKKTAAPPAIPADGSDPSGGKCPFFQKKQNLNGPIPELPAGHPPVDKPALPPVCPFSVAFIQRHSTVFLLMSFSFIVGMYVDQMLNRYLPQQ